MVFVRRRYYVWLAKAYFKKWKKTVLLSLLFGGILFFLMLLLFSFYIQPIIDKKTEKIGIAGIYTVNSLPDDVLNQMSYGLTIVDENGKIMPGAASSWEIKNNGKEYVFHLKKGLTFNNGKKFNAEDLPLEFKDVNKKIIDDNTVSYELKNPYSPFLVSVSKPIFVDGFSGLGDYSLKKMDVDSGFVKSIVINYEKDPRIKKTIYFYPSEESLKTAFALGEVDEISGVTNINLKGSSLNTWKNVKTEETTDYNKLVTLFYNNSDSNLSSKKFRQALNYALPEKFSEGERAYSPISVKSIYYNSLSDYGIFDLEIAKTLLASSGVDTKKLTIEISTPNEYENVAKEVKESWAKLGVNSKIEIVDEKPSDFQVLIFPYRIPKDPDQYTLWHSNQVNNITRYKNLRIDKLLEDGRVTSNVDERIKIYKDFQKYLSDDTPASFLFFPYEYSAQKVFK